MSFIQAERYIQHLENIMTNGHRIYPRGEEVLEIEDLQLIVDPWHPFMNFEARKYPLAYFKNEMRWKLGANKYDRSIEKHAAMWDQVRNPDGTFNSNYGQYWFGEQAGIWSVVMELIRDPDSRRAVIPMLNASHMAPEVKDTVCTESVGFRIRRDESGIAHLNMSVHMRSSDSVFGLGTDIPTFSFLYRLVLALIRPSIPFSVDTGDITITAMSSHIYKRHYVMVRRIIEQGLTGYQQIPMPFALAEEAMWLIAHRGKTVPKAGGYTLARWLMEE